MAVPKVEERVNIPIDADKARKPKRIAKAKSIKAKSEIKTKRLAPTTLKKKKKIYTAEELGVPKLNGIVPSGVQKPKGKKKGKVFVDDAKSMMAILGMVQAEKEGEVEGKMVKARQLEEIREAKRVEAEERFEKRKEKMEERKDAIRKMKRRNRPEKDLEVPVPKTAKPFKPSKKRVSFG